MLTIVVILICLVFANFAYSASYIVTQVKDGDTLVVSPVGKKQNITCRLYGIDAPELSKKNQKGMPYAQESADALKKLVIDRNVDVEFTGNKSYDRNICVLYGPDGKNINLEMVKLGLAWAYVQYLKRPHASEFLKAEEEARKAKKGLWQQTNPIPPWEWRKRDKK